MTAIHEISSGVSNHVDVERRKLVDYVESVGRPSDPVATSIDDENSAFSLLKGIFATLGGPVGPGTGDVNNNANIYPDLRLTLGQPTDTAATSASDKGSAIAFLKAIGAEWGV